MRVHSMSVRVLIAVTMTATIPVWAGVDRNLSGRQTNAVSESPKASPTAAAAAVDSRGEAGVTRVTADNDRRPRDDAGRAPALPAGSADSAVAAGGLPNDGCATPTAITGEGSFAFDNSAATGAGPMHPACVDANDPDGDIGRDLWYCWTSTCDGDAVVDTCNAATTVDTKIAVYDGCVCPTAGDSPLDCNDDGCANQSSVSFATVLGQTYMIRLGSFPGGLGGSGQFDITCVAAPICTQPAGRCQDRDSSDANTSDRTNFIVSEGFSPATTSMVNEVCWWGAYSGPGGDCQGTAPDTFEVRYFEDAGGFPGTQVGPTFSQSGGTLLVNGPVPTGDLVAGVVPEYAFTATHADVPVSAGQCYWMEITNTVAGDCLWFWERGMDGDGRSLQDGALPDGYGLEDVRASDLAFCLNVDLAPPGVCLPPAPANDDCANSIEIFAGTTLFETASATTDGPAEPSCNFLLNDDQINADIWFHYTATCSETLQVSLCGSGFDTKLAVYDGTACPPAGAPTACDDDFCELQSQVSLPVTQGTTYKIRVGGFREQFMDPETGPGQISINCAAAPPNDNCADVAPEPLSVGVPLVFSGTNLNATHECNFFTGAHVWIAFELSAQASVTIDYSGTSPAFGDAWANMAIGCGCTGISPPSNCDARGGDTNWALTWDCMDPGVYYYPVLSEPGSEGSYQITVSAEPCLDRCGEAVGDCFAAHPSPGCEDPACCSLVCAEDSVCCCDEWDSICAAEAASLCGGWDAFCATATGDCCSAQADGGCGDGINTDCCVAVCDCDPFCCDTEWDVNCAGAGFGKGGCGAEVLCGSLCAGCPDGTISKIDPPVGWRDAGQPHEPGTPAVLQGVDTLVVSGPDGAASPECWSLCETTANTALHPTFGLNTITAVVSSGPGQYTITLAQPLTPGELTTLIYLATVPSSLTYAVLPGDVNGDGTTGPPDILAVIDSLNGVVPQPDSQADVDRSTVPGPPDILRVIDLLNGAGQYEVWFGATLQDTGECQ